METISVRPLAVESFSDSWLSNARPSLVNVLELDNELSQTISSNSFDFDTPIRFNHDEQHCDDHNHGHNHDHHVMFVHADEIFSNGLIKPAFAHPSSVLDFGASSLSHGGSSGSDLRNDNRVISDANDGHELGSCCLLQRRRSRRVLFEQILGRLFGFVRRTRLRKSNKSSTKVDDIDRRTMEVSKSFHSSPQTSPCSSNVYSNYDVESSIQEAVLHCKRSIGK